MAEKPKAGEMRKRNFEKINSVLPRLHKAINSNVYDKKDVQYKPVSYRLNSTSIYSSLFYSVIFVRSHCIPDSQPYYLDTKKKIE